VNKTPENGLAWLIFPFQRNKNLEGQLSNYVQMSFQTLAHTRKEGISLAAAAAFCA